MACDTPGLDLTGAAPRAAGVRRRYHEIPSRVRAWVDERLGSPVVGTDEQAGGMSPGCATRLVTADGTRAFVKAVGPELNPRTPDLFRHEAVVLAHLGQDPLWAGLLSTYDEPGGWVALVLEDVPGRHPDLTDPAATERLLESTDRLVERLAGEGAGLDIGTLGQSLDRFEPMWSALAGLPTELLPRWCLLVAEEMRERLQLLRRASAGDHLVNRDIRNDNLLVRDDGSLVFVDWGMARTGAPWVDPLTARLEWVEQPVFDDLVGSSPVLRDLGDEQVTTYLYTFGAFLAFRTTEADNTGLPTIDAFRRHEARRLLEGARRRLGITD